MAEETKTHWKKNLDSNFISGEDLQLEVHGLKKEMIVTISSFQDAETFDQNKQAKVVKSGLFLKTQDGKDVYKPALLNKTNGKFFTKEFGSDFMEDWLNKPVIMYAQKDSRHGYVVRYKKYQMPHLQAGTENFNKCKQAIINSGYTVAQIRLKYIVSAEVEAELLKPIPAAQEENKEGDAK